MLGREPFLVSESFLLWLTYLLSSRKLDLKGQHRFASGLLLLEIRTEFKQTEVEESLGLGVPMSMMDVTSIRPLSQWRESCLTYSLEWSALLVDVGSSSARKTAHSTRGAVCMLFHWEVKQRRLHTLTMSNEGWVGVANTSCCCWQLGDVFFP